MNLSGRRPNDRARRIGKGLLDGLAFVGTAMSDGPKFARIQEIDAEIERLQHEKDGLIADLIEPGDLKVSEGYDPNKAIDRPILIGTDGRLTKCKGRWSISSKFHDAHPGCPYVNTVHNAHEFTLRD